MLEPILAALPDEQRRLWPALADVPDAFVLYGGTALALRLGHRSSVDFDFFRPLRSIMTRCSRFPSSLVPKSFSANLRR